MNPGNVDAGMKTLSLVWFRVGDLRIHDHEPLTRACSGGNCNDNTVVPFVIWEDTSCGNLFRREAIRRAIVCLEELVKERGSKLIILKDDWRVGLRALSDYAVTLGCSELNFHFYLSPHMCLDPLAYGEQEDMMQDVLPGLSLPVHCFHYWGRTLFHPEDMSKYSQTAKYNRKGSLETVYPGSLNLVRSCENMTQFRESCQGVVPVRSPYPIPEIYAGEIDGLYSALVQYRQDSLHEISNRLQTDIYCDEVGACRHLDTILSDPEYMSSYRTSRMSASPSHKGAMLSTALSLGSLSPRIVYESIRQRMDPSWAWTSKIQASSRGEEWLLMHLAIRDFFLYSSELEAEDIFSFGDDHTWSDTIEDFEKWKNGETGYPFVDASMRELAATGFMSNRGRQNVASFLTKAINIDWRWGASYFAKILIDHEPGVNLESWAYIAGVGPGRRDSKFLTVSQGEKYDPEATYISTWIPELQHVDTQQKHRPWLISDASIIAPYPQPMIPDTSSQCRKR